MPTYEYICAKCGHDFDIAQSIKDKALTVCPKDKCRRKPWGKGKVKRAIVGGSGLIFKGSGFYSTDYRSEKYKAAAKKDANAGANASAAESKSSKTDAKPTPSTPAPASPKKE